MHRTIRWLAGASLVFALSLGLAACTSPTLPRFPDDEERDRDDPSDEPSQAMFMDGVTFTQNPILV